MDSAWSDNSRANSSGRVDVTVLYIIIHKQINIIRCEGLVWLDMWTICTVVQCPMAVVMDDHMMRFVIISRCQSAATFEIAQRCWLRHVLATL